MVNGKRGRDAEPNGDPDGEIWSIAQGVGLIHVIQTCAEQDFQSMVHDADCEENIVRICHQHKLNNRHLELIENAACNDLLSQFNCSSVASGIFRAF